MMAQVLIQDYELPRNFHEAIVQSIRQQVTLFTNMSEIEMPARRAVIKLEVRTLGLCFNDMRVSDYHIAAQIPLGTTALSDVFEWDHDEPLNSPEKFAEAYCADLGLGGEYVSLVAHAIHEQLFLDRKVRKLEWSCLVLLGASDTLLFGRLHCKIMQQRLRRGL